MTTAITDLIKAAFWPAIVLLLFIEFHEDIKRVITMIPSQFERASKVQFGDLVLEIREQAAQTGDSELARILGDLNSAEIAALLRIPAGTNYGLTGGYGDNRPARTLPLTEVVEPLFSLARRGLVEFTVPVERLEADIHSLSFRVEASSRVFDFSEGASDAAKELDRASYSLTERGKAGVDAVIKAVATQLTRVAV